MRHFETALFLMFFFFAFAVLGTMDFNDQAHAEEMQKAKQAKHKNTDMRQVRLLVEAHKAAYRIADVAEPIIYK